MVDAHTGCHADAQSDVDAESDIDTHSDADADPTPTPTPTPPPSSAPHVLIVLEENKGYAAVMSGAPYLDGLAKSYLNSSSWFGVDHPSAPNYVALLSGSTQTVVGDCTPPNCGPYNVTSLPGQLAAAGIPWTAYMESMPTPCYAGSTFGLYAEKHDPFMYFDDVLKNNCASHVLPYPGSSSLVARLDGPNAPDFVWITPNLLDDMHDGSVLQGDAWARANLGPVFASSWFKDYNSTVIVTMDEGDADGTGVVLRTARGRTDPDDRGFQQGCRPRKRRHHR